MENIKKKVIIDTDMGWDDVLSLLYLMKNPSVEIVGVKGSSLLLTFSKLYYMN